MGIIPQSLKSLTFELQRIPGIGPKSARRMAYFLFSLPQERLDFLGNTLKEIREKVNVCSFCNMLADTNPCEVCGNSEREQNVICIVADNMDVYAIERTAGYKGLYYVLSGLISPVKGHGPDDVNIKGLLNRLGQLEKKIGANEKLEVVFALSPTTEGQTTALYIKEELYRKFEDKILVSRVAIGLSVGTDIDYVDTYTLQEAIKGRSKL